MNHAWSMQLSLRLDEHGWSGLDLWLGDSHHDFCITHVFNSPMVEMANAVLALHQGASETTFTLHEEPGKHVWTMRQIPEEQYLLHVEIRSSENDFKPSKPACIDFRVARDFFIGSFLMELNKIAFQLQHPRFAKDRDNGDFPWSTLRKLRLHYPKLKEPLDAGIRRPDGS